MKLFENNIENLQIIALETLKNISKEDLRYRERYYQEKINSFCNMSCAIRDTQEKENTK